MKRKRSRRRKNDGWRKTAGIILAFAGIFLVIRSVPINIWYILLAFMVASLLVLLFLYSRVPKG